MQNNSDLRHGHISKQEHKRDINYSKFTGTKQSEKVNIGLGDSGGNMFEPVGIGDRNMYDRRQRVKAWSLNRRLAEESMLAYSNRVRNLTDKYQQDLVNHRDRLAIQALIQRARGHKKWAPLPKVGTHEPDEKGGRLDLKGVGEKKEDATRATSDLGIHILYNSDWDEPPPNLYPNRPASDSYRGVLPNVAVYRPYKPTDGLPEDQGDSLKIKPGRTIRGESEEGLGSQYSPLTASPDMAAKGASSKNCSVEIVAFPEIPLQATQAVLHSNPVSLQQRPTKGGKKSAKQTKLKKDKPQNQFSVRHKLPPIPKIDGVRAKRPPFVRKGASGDSRSTTPAKGDGGGTSNKIRYSPESNTQSQTKLRKSSAESIQSNTGDDDSSKPKVISVTVKKKGKKVLEQIASISEVSPPPNTPRQSGEDSPSPSDPQKELSDTSTIKSVLRKGTKAKTKNVQFGAELEFVRMVTKIEYPWYNEDSDAEGEEDIIEEEETAEEETSESEISDTDSDISDKGKG